MSERFPVHLWPEPSTSQRPVRVRRTQLLDQYHDSRHSLMPPLHYHLLEFLCAHENQHTLTIATLHHMYHQIWGQCSSLLVLQLTQVLITQWRWKTKCKHQTRMPLRHTTLFNTEQNSTTGHSAVLKKSTTNTTTLRISFSLEAYYIWKNGVHTRHNRVKRLWLVDTAIIY